MHTHSPVLIAVDLLPHSKHAIELGLTIAKQQQTSALILHVVHDSAENAGVYRSKNHLNITLPMKYIAETMLRELISDMEQKGVDIESYVVEGIPAGRIVEVAERFGIDSIVMADSGHSGLSKFWFGSVVKSVRKRLNGHKHREIYLANSDSLMTEQLAI